MKKLLLFLSAVILITGCTYSGSTNNGSIDDSATNKDDDGDDSGDDDKTIEYAVKTVNFYDQKVFSGQLEHETVQTSFVNYVNGNSNILSYVTLQGKSEIKGVTFSYTENKEVIENERIMWWVGSAAEVGEVTLGFNVDVAYFKLTVQPYFKKYYYDGIQMSVDKNAQIFIDDKNDKLDLTVFDTSEDPKISTIKREYDEPVRQITFGNLDIKQRVFIREIEITYIA